MRRELFAEFLGTFMLILFGAGVVAQNILSDGKNGSYLAINVSWGIGVMIGVYVAGRVTGGHLNPAVTVALAVRRGFPWKKVVPYSVAQTFGAFCAAAVVVLVYREAFSAFDGGVRMVEGAKATAGIFATYPQPFLSTLGGFIDQVVGTAILLLGVMALGDSKNLAPQSNLGPVMVGILVIGIGMAFGFNSGYAINPARDLGPRLLTFLAGWGTAVFTAGNHWFWVPIVAPIIGAVLGATVYDLLVGRAVSGPDN